MPPFEDDGDDLDSTVREEEDDGEDLFDDNLERFAKKFCKIMITLQYTNKLLLCYGRDYRSIPALDVYERTGIDNIEYEQMSPGARHEAEIAMRKRDREEARIAGRLREGVLYGMYHSISYEYFDYSQIYVNSVMTTLNGIRGRNYRHRFTLLIL